MADPIKALYECGYCLVVIDDDGDDIVYDDIVDFAPMWSDGEMSGLMVKTERAEKFHYTEEPEQISLIRRDTLDD